MAKKKNKKAPKKSTSPQFKSPRLIAAQGLAQVAVRYPNLFDIQIETSELKPQDIALAHAIFKTGLHRWRTIEAILNKFSHKKFKTYRPAIQGVLASAVAQFVFMQRIPDHAVANESVKVAKQILRQGEPALINAICRNITESISSVEKGEWLPSERSVPTEDGYVNFTVRVMPHPGNPLTHLAVATSLSDMIVKQWGKAYGWGQASELCQHACATGPLVLKVEDSFEIEVGHLNYIAHQEAGFILWQGSYTAMTDFLTENPERRVQDVASVRVMEATRKLRPKRILDYCAGKGTKTKQAATMHPDAQVIAMDVDQKRGAILAESLASISSVQVVAPDAVKQAVDAMDGVDLLMLDVPCTNSGVLGRRLEARYRFNAQRLADLVEIQREIVEKTVPMLVVGGHLLYSTCSLEAEENVDQVDWICQTLGFELISFEQTLPKGIAETYQDGSYYALLKKC